MAGFVGVGTAQAQAPCTTTNATGCLCKTSGQVDCDLLPDITISGCRDVRFNARYAGQLDATNPARSRLRLHAITAISPVTADGYRELAMATIDAALRR